MSISRLIIISFFCTLLTDAIYYINAAMHVAMAAGTYIIILRLISFICLMIIAGKIKWKKLFPVWANLFFSAMMLWNVISIVRGFFSAESYFDWKYLLMDAGMSFFVPYAIITGALYNYSYDLFKIMITKLFVFGFLIIPLTVSFDLQRELFPRGFVVTAPFFVLLIPFVKLKWRIVIMCVALVSVFIALDFRTNIIRTGISLSIVGIYYTRKIIPPLALKLFCAVLFIMPVVFLILGITNQYNVFKPQDDIDKFKIEYDNGLENNLAEDTRTFLYDEVFRSMRSRNSFLFGESANGKYTTEYFEETVVKGKQRYGSEVGFLNMLLYSGIIGVILYALVLISATYYSMVYSNNFLCKMLAISLAFKWIVFFIEDFMEYNMNYYILWLSVGLCLSKKFRAMTDSDIRKFFDFSTKKETAVAAVPVSV